MPTGPPPRAISPGVMPMLHSPGVMMPGQLGPSSRVFGKSRRSTLNVRASSCAGMPSVMHTTNGMPASAASRMAAGEPEGGTATNDAVAPVASTASFTEPKTGTPSISSPARFGFTPPTTLVPYALLRRPWKPPCEVGLKPWMMTLVSLFTKMDIELLPSSERHGLARGIEHRRLRTQPVGQVGLQDLASLFGIGAVEADHDRRVELDPLERLHDAVGDLFTARDAAEDVDEDRLHLVVG